MDLLEGCITQVSSCLYLEILMQQCQGRTPLAHSLLKLQKKKFYSTGRRKDEILQQGNVLLPLLAQIGCLSVPCLRFETKMREGKRKSERVREKRKRQKARI